MADLCSTGETPWVRSVIDKYHETAKANGAIVSWKPHIGGLGVLIYSRLSPLLELKVHLRIS